MKLLFLVLVLTFGYCWCGLLKFENRCTSCPIEVENIEMNPDPAVIGQEVTMSVNCNLRQPYGENNQGTMEMKVYYSLFGFWVLGETLHNNTCDMIKVGNKDCPMNAGPESIPFKMMVDASVPAGSYSGETWIRDGAGNTNAHVVIYWDVIKGKEDQLAFKK